MPAWRLGRVGVGRSNSLFLIFWHDVIVWWFVNARLTSKPSIQIIPASPVCYPILAVAMSSIQNLASFLQVQPGPWPMPYVLTSCPWLCLWKPRQEPPWEPAHCSYMYNLEMQGIGISRLYICECTYETPHESNLWSTGGGGVLSWWILSSLFPALDGQQWDIHAGFQAGPQDRAASDPQAWPSNGASLTGSVSLLRSPVTHPLPESSPQFALVSGFAFWQNQFKTELIKNF